MGLFSKKIPPGQAAPSSIPQSMMRNGEQSPHHWSLFEEGQLLVDMYEAPDAIIVRSFVAGAEPDDIEISMHNDMLTIRGTRRDQEEIHDDRFFFRECHWGTFSRSLIIPKAVDASHIRALFKNGVITILLPVQK